MLKVVALCIGIATIVVSEDIVTSESEDVDPVLEVLLRSRRSAKAAVCKYKKGDWSPCDEKVFVSKILEIMLICYHYLLNSLLLIAISLP